MGVNILKYIYFDKRKGNYVLTKRVLGKKYNFGSYKSLKECKTARDYFQKNGWGNCLNERLKFSYTKHDNINWLKSKRVWQIRKTINGKSTIFGHFKDYDAALNRVESLEKVNWDAQLLFKLRNKDEDILTECPRCGRAFA